MNISRLLLIVILQFASSTIGYRDHNLPTCHSKIYCQGSLLDTVQMARIFEDSKTFVDMKLRQHPDTTLANFRTFMNQFNGTKPTQSELSLFVTDNFEAEGQEFETWIPDDWVQHPSFIDKIEDPNFHEWLVRLNGIWKILGRKIKNEVKLNPDLYSIIWVPNPMIVPGGRFREFYYWDSYWIVQGLLLSEMQHTVKGILENFLTIVDKHGHIPNGGRIYYLARSQPPLLIPMIEMYVDYTGDQEFVKNNIILMEKEFQYWMQNHTVTVEKNGKEYRMAYYGDRSYGPRPESYFEDVDAGKLFKDQRKKEDFYSELKAAAESGWDFSSRWFVKNGTNKGNLTDLRCRSIIPVDLNSMIYWNAVILAKFHSSLGNTSQVEYYNNLAKDWEEAVSAVLWHEDIGAWLDYDISNNMRRNYFYPTNVAPLWTGCYNKVYKEGIVRLVLKYLQNQEIWTHPGGIPTTNEFTGEQWDYPNAWPPLQHMMIIGLNNTGDASAQRLAFEIAEKWVRSNYKAFNETEYMFEKYDATTSGGHGGGGEYELQKGFGWTNGIIMDLLHRYAKELTVEDPVLPSKKSPIFSTGTPAMDIQTQSNDVYVSHSNQITIIALLISLAVGFMGICIYLRRSPTATKKGRNAPSSYRYAELSNLARQKSSR